MGVPPIDQTRNELLRAWREWDDTPGHPLEAARAERAFEAHAAHFGMRVTPFRHVCAAWRHAGLSREQALAAVEAGYAATLEGCSTTSNVVRFERPTSTPARPSETNAPPD